MVKVKGGQNDGRGGKPESAVYQKSRERTLSRKLGLIVSNEVERSRRVKTKKASRRSFISISVEGWGK